MSRRTFVGRFVLYAALPALLSPAGPFTPGLIRAAAVGLALTSLEWRLGRLFDPSIAFLATLTLATSNSALGLAASDRGIGPLAFFVAGCGACVALLARRSSSATKLSLALAGMLSLAPTVAALAPSPSWSIDAQDMIVALFGSPNGLLYSTPLLWAGFIGSVWMRREDPFAARLTWAATIPGTLALAATSATDGHPRVEAWMAFLTPGLAWSFRSLQTMAARSPHRVVATAGAVLIGWNLLFMEQYRRLVIPNDDTVSFARVTSNSARLLSRFIGTPSAWPANWVYARRFHTSPDRWDGIAGRRLFANPDASSVTIEIGDDPSELAPDLVLLEDGFGDRHTCEKGWCRDLKGEGRIFLPLYDGAPMDLVIRIRARGRGELRLSLNHSTSAIVELGETLVDVVLRPRAESVRRGVNVLSLTIEGGGDAALDRLSLDRVTPGSPVG